MADLRGQELRDSYQNVVTRGTGATPIEDGNGSPYFYEEGEFTAQFTPENGSFTSVDYNRDNGLYTKVGNIVHVLGYITLNSIDTGDASGQLSVSLPFTSVSSPIMIFSGSVSRYRALGGNGISIQISPNSNNALIRKENKANFTDENIDPQDLSSSTIFSFSLSYKI